MMITAFTKLSTVRNYYPQWLTGLGATVIYMELGIMCGWSSPYLAHLTSTESSISLTSDQASWVASLLNFGRFIGAFCGAISIHYLGSKRSLTLAIVPLSFCWVFTMIADSFVWLYAARASGGFGTGMTHSCFALYVGEVALPEIRGALLSLAIVGGSTVGVVASSICGSYLSMHMSAAIYLAPCLGLGMLFLWLPESPHWLVKLGNYEYAKKSIAWYQPGNNPNKEVDIIKDLETSSTETFCDRIQKFKTKPIAKAILLIIVLFTFMQLTGFNSILFYMETILRRSKLTVMDPSTLVIYANASGILATMLSMFLIDTFGRKFVLIVSCIGVTMSMAGLGSNAYLVSIDTDMQQWQWLPITSVFLFVITYFIGLLSVPNTILSEIFPSDIKGIAGCISSLVGAVSSFAVTRSFQPLVDAIGEYYVFWLHGVFAFILIPYVLICMPETKGKSLQDIQNELIRTK